MVNASYIMQSLNYLQRINYSLKRYYLKTNNSERTEHSVSRIKNFNMHQTLNLFKTYSLENIFNEEEIKIFSKLKRYYTFICDTCFLEFQYDLNTSIYHKKVDYVNAKAEYIQEQLKMFCYKVECLAFES